MNTARSANLIAEKNAITLTTAKGTGRNWLTALAGAIDSLFGSDGLSGKFDTGDTTLIQTGVQMDGIIRAGTERNQTLTINKFGDVVPSGTTDNIKFSQTEETIFTNLLALKERYIQLQTEYASSQVSVAAYQQEIEEIDNQLREFGLEDIFDFDPIAFNLVDVSGNTINLTSSEALETGTKVIYSNGGETSLGGLNNADIYYLIEVGTEQYQLATTRKMPFIMLPSRWMLRLAGIPAIASSLWWIL